MTTKNLDNFRLWLGANHMEILHNYAFNFQESPINGINVSSNNMYRITDQEQAMLDMIIKEYYAS